MSPASRAGADRDLLLGLLALQNNFIDRDALLAAFATWVADKARPLGRILLERGALDAETLALLEALVRKHLQRHGDDPGRSLAAVRVADPVCRGLGQLGDDDLNASLVLLAARSPEDDPDATVTLDVGTPTAAGNRFRILRSHRRGGLGEVFVAHDGELHREVALKRIRPGHADDPRSRSRFLLEAEITGGLEHPGIVPVYGLGCDPDGRPFYAMRLVRGESLKEAIGRFHGAEGPRRDPGERALTQRRLLGSFVAVCNAVAYAHSRGVIHRDLKPANVLLGPYGETLVVDWGLAKVVGRGETSVDAAEATLRPGSAGGSSETQPGSALGTPAYMSPEQADGRLEELGPASDVYSLGATLYCLLTGRPPFEGADLPEILRQVRSGEFPPPSASDPAIDPALEAVCLKAMASEPDDRYRSPRALADDIERWLASDYERLEQAHRELQRAHGDLRAVQGTLAESEARYRQLTEGCLDAIVVTDRDGRITLFNPAAEKIFGRSAEDVVGRSIALLMPQVFRNLDERGCEAALSSDQPSILGRTVELKGRRGNGEEFPLELSLSSIEIAGSVQLMGAVRDQTERQRMRAMLAQSEKLASIGLLSAGVAHEINNPLAYVANNLAELERDMKSVLEMIAIYECALAPMSLAAPEVVKKVEEVAEELDWPYVREKLPRILARALEGVQRVTSIVQNLRGLARSSPPEKESASIPDMLESALEKIRGRLRRHNIEMLIEHGDVPRVTCVPSQIIQVILNLLINATQAVESSGRTEGGRIHVKTVREGDMVCISMSDNGCGIPGESVPRVFDPFFTTKSVGEGTGLGLSISHGIVTGHGGRIEVETEPGRGCCFRVTLPLRS